MLNLVCADCGDVYPVCNQSPIPGLCMNCWRDERTEGVTLHTLVRDELFRLGYDGNQADHMISTLSPRWTLGAVRLAFHPKTEMIYLLIDAARRMLRLRDREAPEQSEEFVTAAFAQIGWSIPPTVAIHAYLKCAYLAMSYRADGPYRNCVCNECHGEWIDKVLLSSNPHNIDGTLPARCRFCGTKNVTVSNAA